MVSAFLILILITGCSNTEQQELKSKIMENIDSPEVSMIRNMTTDEGVLLGDLFDAALGSPIYELYDPAEDGNTYVTISGNITYRDVPAVMTMQYKKVSDEHYEFYTITVNDIPVNSYEISSFFDFLYNSYYESLEAKNSVTPSNDKPKFASVDDSVTSDNNENEDVNSSETQVQETQVENTTLQTESSSENVESSVADNEGIIISYLPSERYSVDYGNGAELTGDFNDDCVEDTVKFYFEQVGFFLTFYDGASRTAYENYDVIPSDLVDEYGELKSGSTLEIMKVDLDFNGDYELLIAASDNSSISGMKVFDGGSDNLFCAGEIEGQCEFDVLLDGTILAPIGSQGLGDAYVYSGSELSKID